MKDYFKFFVFKRVDNNISLQNTDNKRDYLKFIEIARNIIALFGILGIVGGGLLIRSYLDYIDKLFLFPDLLGNSSSFLAIVIFGLFVGTFFIAGFSIIHHYAYFISDICNLFTKEQALKVFFWVSAAKLLILSLIIFLDHEFESILILAIVIFLLFLSLICIFCKSLSVIKCREKICKVVHFLFVTFFIYYSVEVFAFKIFLIFMEQSFEKGSWAFWVGVFIFLILWVFNHWTARGWIERSKDGGKYLIIIPFLMAIGFAWILLLSDKFKFSLLYPSRFIEKTANSSWYLLHNDFNTKLNAENYEVSGIQWMDLKMLQEKFIPKSCSNTQSRQNALFGYMAWNLGNTKVFCPEGVDFFNGTEEDKRKDLSDQCIVIEGRFLQPLSEQYIASMPPEKKQPVITKSNSSLQLKKKKCIPPASSLR